MELLLKSAGRLDIIPPKRAMPIPNPPALFRFRQSSAASSPTRPQYQEYLGTSDCDCSPHPRRLCTGILCTPGRQTSMTNRCKYPTPNITPTRNSKAPNSSPPNASNHTNTISIHSSSQGYGKLMGRARKSTPLWQSRVSVLHVRHISDG